MGDAEVSKPVSPSHLLHTVGACYYTDLAKLVR